MSQEHPPDEARRQRVVDELGLRGGGDAPALAAIARLVRQHTGWPVGAISLVDAERQWFAAVCGVEALAPLDKADAFCAHAIAGTGPLEVVDARADRRFASSPMVVGAPHVTAYVGIALQVDGCAVGTLCAAHTHPAKLEPLQLATLQDLGTAAAALLQARLNERRSRRQESRVRTASRAGSDWLWETDDRGVVTWVSDSVEAHTGEAPGSAIGREATAYNRPRDDEHAASYEAYLAAREARRPFRDAVAERDTPRGRLTVSLSGDPVFDSEGGFKGYRGAARDVTETLALRERAQSALIEQQRRLAAVLGALPDLWFVLDREGRCLECSDERHPGLVDPLVDSRGRRIDEMLPAAVSSSARQAFEAALETGQAQRIEYELQLEGVARQFEARLTPMGGDRLLYLVRDLTDLRALERDVHLMQRAFEAPGSLPMSVVDATRPDMPLIYVNTAFERLCGRTRSQVLGRNCRVLQGDDRDQPGLDVLRKALASGSGCVVRLRNYRPDGEQFVNELHLAPVHDSEGRVTHFVGVQHDVTERSRSERQLEARETLYRSVTSAITDGLLVINRQGQVVTANPAACRMLGVPLESLTGQDTRRIGIELFLQDGAPLPRHDDPVSEVLRGGPNIAGRVLGVRRPDGVARTFSISAHRLDGGGEPGEIACVVTFRDITEERAAEVALMQAEGRWRFALEEAGDGLLDYDEDTHRAFFSPRWKAMLGYGHHEVGHALQEWSHRIHPDDYPQVIRSVRRYRAGELPEYRSEHRLRHKNGHWVWVLDRAKIVERRPDGSPRRIVGIHTDITRMKAAEQALSDKRAAELANSAKSEFLSRMSHEMRTPLNAVIGFAQLLQMRGDTGRPVPVAQYSEHILQSGRHLLALVNDVLDLQQVEAGRMTLAPEAIDLRHALDGARMLIEPAVRARNIDVSLEIHEELQVWADPRRLQQVLLNILSNAVKYNRIGGTLRCVVNAADTPGAKATAAGKRRAVLIVEDSGEGLRPDQMARLFQPFERLGRETSTVEGSGLGLVISRALVKEMNGTLTMSSEIGVGSRVRIELPVPVPACPPPADASVGAQQRPPRGAPPTAATLVTPGQLRMLYVEDNRLNALLFEEAIKMRGGVELRIVDDGPDAFELLQGWQPDVLVLDAHLPSMSGYEVLARLRQLPRFAHTPAFMCSADALPDELQRARDAGFAGYWSKPIDIAQVMRELDGLPVPGTAPRP